MVSLRRECFGGDDEEGGLRIEIARRLDDVRPVDIRDECERAGSELRVRLQCFGHHHRADGRTTADPMLTTSVMRLSVYPVPRSVTDGVTERLHVRQLRD